MDHELKQRLIGAVVVTALAAIFIPMLFDDPVDNSGQQISELTIPKPPENLVQSTEKKLPEDFGRALTAPDPEEAIHPNTPVDNVANTMDKTTQSAASESPADEELVITEADNEAGTASSSATVKAKTSETSLDTGDVLEVEHTLTPAKAKSIVEDRTPDENDDLGKKKAKTVVAETHKVVKVEEASVDTNHKKTANTKATGLSRWSIQAGSFSKKENAEALLKKLQQQGFPVTLQARGDIYRLRIGPELDKQRAVDMKKRLDKLSIQSLMIAE